MRVQFNIEFTPEELVQHASDLGRRWLHGLFAEGSKHIGPDGLSSVFEALTSAVKAVQSPRKIDAEFEEVKPDYQPAQKCLYLEAEEGRENGWACHLCANFNDDTRNQCKRCGHLRCDIVVTPPPAPNAPSGTA